MENPDSQHKYSTVSLLTAIIESAPTAMVMVDESGSILLVNTETEKLFGYKRDELLGEPVEILVPERFCVLHPGQRAHYFVSPTARRMGAGRDLYGLRKDGSEFPVEIGLNPVVTEEGLLVLSAIIDISERKQHEEAIWNSEKRVSQIVNSALDAVITMNEAGEVTGWNPQAEAIYGWKKEEALNQPLAELVIPEDMREAHKKGIERFLRTGKGTILDKRVELTALHKSGRSFPVELTVTSLRIGNAYEFSAFTRDITERKQLESALYQLNKELEQRVQQRTAELEQAVDALERGNIELKKFAYIASHDLQSPLRNISGFVQLLQSEYEGKLDAQADDWIKRTVQGIKHMQNLIQDLLVYSRGAPEAQSYQQVDMNTVFQNAVTQLDAMVMDAGGEVTRDDLPAVYGDPSQLTQLLQNLVGNGIKYHGESTPKVHVSAVKDGEDWVFCVSDNGIGIEPRFQEQVFEIFKRLHTQKEYPGTGIGLAVCRRVVHDHGGRIWLESEPGQGSKFYFTLPRQKDES